MLEQFKRDKNENVKMYEDNQSIVSSDTKLQTDIETSFNNSTLYLHEPITQSIPSTPNISVINSTSLMEAMKFDDAMILNFASAIHPGGGYVKGSNAQEECLCRSSGLYNVLKQFPEHYAKHNHLDNCEYTDDMIYSPSVPFFRDDFGFLMNKKYINVLTAALPYNKGNNTNTKEIAERRILKVFKIAIEKKQKNLILGAWGCGAFFNDPEIVSKAFKKIIDMNCWDFENIVFAVLDYQDEKLINVFRKNIL